MGDDPGCVLENRRRLATAFGAAPGDFVFAHQAHGADVRVVTASDRGRGAFSLDDAIGSASRRRCGPAGRRGRRARHHLAGGGARHPDRGLRADRAARPGGRRARLRARGLARHRGRGDRRGRRRPAGSGYSSVRRHRRDRPRHRGGPLPGRPRRPRGRQQVVRPGRARVHPPGPVGSRPLAPGPAVRQPPRPPRGGRPRPARIHTTDLVTGPASGHFFSDRTARPCGRLALVARLRPGGER